MKKLIIPPVFVLICFLSIVLFYFLIPKYNLIPFPLNFIGLIISFLGFVIIGKSRDLFKKHNTTLDIKKSSHLITEGIFAKTRNPMYIGMFLLLFGIAVCFMNLFSVLAAIGFILIIQIIFIPTEEKLMYESFGEKYLEYKRKVSRWI
ncbi:methyltransferase family protein [Bacteroidota bacterium]